MTLHGQEKPDSGTFKVGETVDIGYVDQSRDALDPNHNVWVGNAGISGLTTRHHLMMQYLPLREMKIDTIFLLIGINDFTKRLSKNELYDPNFLAKPGAKENLVAETFTGRLQSYPSDTFLKRKAIWQLLRGVKGMLLQKYLQDETGCN